MKWLRFYLMGRLMFQCRDCGYRISAELVFSSMTPCPTCALVERAAMLSDRDGISPMVGAE